jgi:hypothetical protein
MTETFSSMVDDALADLKERVEEWQGIAESVSDSVEALESFLSDRYQQVDSSAYEVDDLLADEHWTAVESQIDDAEAALDGADGELVTLSVLRCVADGGGAVSGFSGQVSSAVTVRATPWVYVQTPSHEESDLRATEYEDYLAWLDDRRDESAHGVRDELDAARDALGEAIGSAGDGETVAALRHATAARHALERARQAYDEWFAVLGTISNVEPGMLGSAATGGLW